jgi:hypothetical protein
MDPALEKAQVSQIDDVSRNTNGQNDAGLDLNNHQKLNRDDTSNLRLDKHGLPLVPQPTQHKDDPLVSQQPCLNTLDHNSNFCRTGPQHSSY